MNTEILKLNYFELFELPINYVIDKQLLQENMRKLQQQYHPDNVAANEELNAMAIQISSHINTAYNVLLNALERAIYLLKLNNIAIDLVHDTKFSHEFLVKQIELREAISDAQESQDIDELEAIEQNLKSEYKKIETQISAKFEVNEYASIVEDIKQLSFYSKLLQLVNNILCEL